MSNLSDQPSGPLPARSQTAFRVALLMLGAAGVYTLYSLYLAIQSGAWQLYAETGVISGYCLIVTGAIVLSRRNRSTLAMTMMIGAMLVTILLVTGLIANLGLSLGVIAVTLTSIVAIQTLSDRQITWAVLSGFVVGILTVLIDSYAPLPYHRPEIPALEIATPGVAGALALVYSIIVIRQFAHYTLRTKMIITLLVVALLPLGLLAFLNTSQVQDVLTAEANQRLLAAASLTAVNVDTFIESNLNAVQAEAQLQDIVGFLNEPVDTRPAASHVEATLTSLSSKNPYILSYAVLNSDGVNVSDSNRTAIGTNESANDYFLVPLQNSEPYVSPIQVVPETGAPVLYFSAPVFNTTGQPLGVLRARFDASVLEALIQKSVEYRGEQAQSIDLIGEKTTVILLDENHVRLIDLSQPHLNFTSVTPLDGETVARLKREGRLPDLPITDLSTNLPSFDRALSMAATQPNFTGVAHPGQELEQGAIATLKTRPWSVVFVQARSAFLGPIEDQRRNVVFLVGLISGTVAVLAITVSQFLARPITHLTQLARQVTRGNLSVRMPFASQDEIGQLAEAFNRMTDQLQTLIGSLEDQVQDRTAELSLSMEVGQRASTIRDLDVLLPTMANLILERFQLYHVQIYLVNDLRQHLVLRAGSDQAGLVSEMFPPSLPIDRTTLVGRAALAKEPMIVPDRADSDLYQVNSLLPETQSELAIPLIVEESVIGVLDMHASIPHTFTTDNLTVFEAMATQLAISIDSAQQWALAQQAQQRLEQVVGQLTREAWLERLSTQNRALGFSYNLSTVEPVGEGTPNDTVITVPVTVQNQPIGQLAVQPASMRSLTDDERDLLTAVAQQLAQKAENLRLFEETQQNATREQIARQITDKIRASHDVETALQTAAQELSRVLSIPKAAIDLEIVPKQSEG